MQIHQHTVPSSPCPFSVNVLSLYDFEISGSYFSPYTYFVMFNHLCFRVTGEVQQYMRMPCLKNC